MKRSTISTSLLRCLYCCFAFLLLSSTAIAQSAEQDTKACLKEANTAKRTCQAACQSDHIAAVGVCTGTDPVCRTGCRDAYKACVKPLNAELKDCVAECTPALETARAACRTECNCTGSCKKNSCYRECVKPALITHYACKQTCRDAWLTNEALQGSLKTCLDTRKTCVSACTIEQ